MAISALQKLYTKVRTIRQSSFKSGKDQNIPVRVQDLSDLEDKVNEVVTQVNTNETNISGVTPSYTTYKAFLNQAGTGAPTATILENTIGTIVWTYTSTGKYIGTLAGVFTANKTVCLPPTNYGNTDDASGIPSRAFCMGTDNVNTVYVETGEASTIGIVAPKNGLLATGYSYIEIIIYP